MTISLANDPINDLRNKIAASGDLEKIYQHYMKEAALVVGGAYLEEKTKAAMAKLAGVSRVGQDNVELGQSSPTPFAKANAQQTGITKLF